MIDGVEKPGDDIDDEFVAVEAGSVMSTTAGEYVVLESDILGTDVEVLWPRSNVRECF